MSVVRGCAALAPLLAMLGCGTAAAAPFDVAPGSLPGWLPAVRVAAVPAAGVPSCELLTSAAQWRRLAAQWGLGDELLPSGGFDWRSTDLLVVSLGDAGGAAIHLDVTEEEGVDVLLVTRAPPPPAQPGRPAVLVAELVRRPSQLAVVFRQQLADQPGVERTLAVFAGR
jgi:hypothetical protein